jgi:hypothetical protein
MGWVCVVAGTPGTWYEFGPISKSIDKEYGSLRYKADTISVSTSFVKFDSIENRPRSLETVGWLLDTLKLTNSGRYRVEGFLNCASEDAGVDIELGLSISGAAPLGEFIVRQRFINASQFFVMPFGPYFIQFGQGKYITMKLKRLLGTGDVYIRNGWLTVERLN